MRKLSVLLSSCVLIVTTWSPVFGRTETLEGLIRDSRTHTGVPFAKVELLYREVRVGLEYSDHDGRFIFGNVSPVSYKILAGAPGFDSVAIVVDATTERRIELELRRSAATLQRVPPVVSIREYRIPEKAQKEFDKAEKEINREDCVKAIKHLENGLRLYDQHASALNDLGNCRRRLGDYQGAEEAFKRAIAMSDAPYIVMNLAETFTAQQRFIEAEDILLQAIRKTSDNGHAYYALAIAYFKQQRLEDAEAAALRADSGKHMPDLHLLLAQIYAQTGPEKVMTQLQRYLVEAPNSAQSKQVRELLEKMGS